MHTVRLPSLGHFQNGNGWLGSAGALRFQVEDPVDKTPEDAGKRQDEKDLLMTVVLWQGPYSRPYAQTFGQETFEVTQAGLDALLDYLDRHAQSMAQTPRYTDAELRACYLARKAQEDPS